MKLVEKYNRHLIFLLVGLLIPLIIALVLSIDFISRKEIKENLHRHIEIVAVEIAQNGTYNSLYPIYEVKEVSLPISPIVFSEVQLYDKIEDEMETFYQIHEVRLINGKKYELISRVSTLDIEELLFGIITSISIFSLLLILLLYVINTRLASRLWLPFNQYMGALKSYSVDNQLEIHRVDSDIDEFNELGTILNQITKKLSLDFNNLKQFTENASHEIQTPLAIIRTKIEEIVGGSQLDASQADKISIIYNSTNQLSKLNQSLLLMAKIENQQYQDESEFDLGQFAEERLKFLIQSQILNDGQIKMIHNNDCRVIMSKTLAEILLNNLIKNMIVHSSTKDCIGHIEISDNAVKFINEGLEGIPYPENIFDRFYKDTSNAKSMGLGLSIVKAICDHYNYTVIYNFHDGNHIFEINTKINTN